MIFAKVAGIGIGIGILFCFMFPVIRISKISNCNHMRLSRLMYQAVVRFRERQPVTKSVTGKLVRLEDFPAE
ncbi:hypothetical protein OB13_13475 [Pontibacter sp. HJ8]